MSSSTSSSSYSPARIALVTTGVLASAVVAYAAYFDYKRRNDPVFRKKLLKQQKKVEKQGQEQAAVGRAQVVAALKRAITLINQEQVPRDVEGREQFFMEQVAMGEQLAARSPEFYVASAISFYKALKVYPAPQELIMIYQKTQPAPVFDLVMELITLEMSSNASAGSASSASEPLLQEIDEPVNASASAAKAPAAAGSTTSTSSSDNTTGSSPSSGSFVVVEEGKQQATSSAAAVAAAASEATASTAEATPAVASESPASADKSSNDPPEPVLEA